MKTEEPKPKHTGGLKIQLLAWEICRKAAKWEKKGKPGLEGKNG